MCMGLAVPVNGWQSVAAMLQAQGYFVVLMDLPGHGVHASDNFAPFICRLMSIHVCHQLQALQDLHADCQLILRAIVWRVW